ncbi:DNA polymerase III subunit delta' [Vibrio renipiscarius]|uniref:DNA polymerase III subunit delta' n=1 Tax=Vibrio renipiscarius TaxID=1461322 RepID=A0A0C2NU19_9VIBR|nr:DNA polymerase III subunit delta' [Vibrio renipiscarius]KII79680.1 DNA polymerase III subunit delta' [Vibrio renipiscarius]KII80693.1 DNA polymerase III subunit delta' [Vibrio renipiscarius]
MSQLYPWLAPLWHQWQADLEHDRFPNAALLIAKAGLGVDLLVNKFSQAVMCSNYAADPCGFCHSCQLMAASHHPDYHRVVPEKEGKSITVEQIRQCNRIAQESSQLAGYRLIVIEPAEAMNESAANALLKTLETPSEKCLFLLVASSASQLLPTITSRCQQWHVGEPDTQTLTQWLSEQTALTVPPYAAHLNGNSPLKTLRFIEEKEQSRYQSMEQQLLAVTRKQGDVIKLAKELAGDAEQSLNWLWYLLTDAQKCHFGLTLPNRVSGADELANRVSYQLLYTQSEALRELIGQLTAHSGLNRELLILDWLINFNEDVCL